MAGQRQLHRGETLRVSQLAGDRGLIENHRFEECHLVGPAVVVPLGSTFTSTNFAEAAVDIVWEVDIEHRKPIGAIAFKDCEVVSFQFTNVGFAGTREFGDQMRR